MKFAFIDTEKVHMSLSRLCAFAGVSISSYYAWKHRVPNRRQLDDMVILAHIRNQFALSRETYGSPRTHVELNEQGIRAGRHRTARLMRENGLELKSDADTNGHVWAWFTLNGKELVEFVNYEDYKCSVGLGQSNLKNCECGLMDDEIDANYHIINAYIRENEEAWAFLEEHEAMWEACRSLTDIRPNYDEDADSDILTFAVNGDDHSEFLDSDGTLGRQSGDGSVKYRLDDDFSEAVRDAICERLGDWVRDNRRERFSFEPEHSEIERIEHGLHISSGDIVVWLAEDAAERLNLDGNAYEIAGDGSVSWRDRDYGDQYSENGAGGDTEENARKHMFANPEAGIGEIENSIEFGNLSQLREEA